MSAENVVHFHLRDSNISHVKLLLQHTFSRFSTRSKMQGFELWNKYLKEDEYNAWIDYAIFLFQCF